MTKTTVITRRIRAERRMFATNSCHEFVKRIRSTACPRLEGHVRITKTTVIARRIRAENVRDEFVSRVREANSRDEFAQRIRATRSCDNSYKEFEQRLRAPIRCNEMTQQIRPGVVRFGVQRLLSREVVAEAPVTASLLGRDAIAEMKSTVSGIVRDRSSRQHPDRSQDVDLTDRVPGVLYS